MGSIYIRLAPHCEHNETGCYIIDTGFFFFFSNTLFYLNININVRFSQIPNYCHKFDDPFTINMNIIV